MKLRNSRFYLMIVGLGLFLFLYFTGEVFLYSFDEVTQIEGAKITNFDEYQSNAVYELIMFSLSVLFFVLGSVILLIRKKEKKTIRRN